MKTIRTTLIALFAAVAVFSVAPSASAATELPAEPGARVADVVARQVLAEHGVGVYSSGKCADRANRRCTSLDTMLASAVREVLWLRDNSGCPVLVTGGTEVGHAKGVRSHYNGFKVDVQATKCVNAWVKAHTTKIPKSTKRLAPSGAIWWLEGSHWDVVVPA